MLFENAGNPASQKRGMLLHAMAVDSSQFNKIRDLLVDEYFLIIPTFDGHHAGGDTPFTSIENQTDKILVYLREKNITELDFIAGVSLGALIGFEIYRRTNIKVRKYVFDGGPFFLLSPMAKFALRCLFWPPFALLKAYPCLAWIGKRKFGEELTAIAVKVTAFITKRDIYNMVSSMGRAEIPVPLNREDTSLIFIYGDQENAYRSFKRFRDAKGCRLIVNNGYGHCQYIMQQSAEYAAILRS
ncbi:hypothetical protein LQZ18_16525 [Lachnospiraceae bacterium ZAX-1]